MLFALSMYLILLLIILPGKGHNLLAQPWIKSVNVRNNKYLDSIEFWILIIFFKIEKKFWSFEDYSNSLLGEGDF